MASDTEQPRIYIVTARPSSTRSDRGTTHLIKVKDASAGVHIEAALCGRRPLSGWAIVRDRAKSSQQDTPEITCHRCKERGNGLW